MSQWSPVEWSAFFGGLASAVVVVIAGWVNARKSDRNERNNQIRHAAVMRTLNDPSGPVPGQETP